MTAAALDRDVRRPAWVWALGIAFGVGTHLLFAWMVWNLFWFLRDGAAVVEQPSYWWNALLALQFAIPHSILLWPPTRRVITQWLPSQFYSCLFCIATSVSLLLLVAGWQGSPVVLWEATGLAYGAVRLGFYLSWALMFYGMSLNGFGYQTGLTPWWHWITQTPVPPREFNPRSVYHILRHPVYLSFLGLIWFTPRMTLDHAVLTGLWTAYVFLGSYFKDERLAFYYGERYRQYQARVPGYPLFPGVLGTRPDLAKADPPANLQTNP